MSARPTPAVRPTRSAPPAPDPGLLRPTLTHADDLDGFRDPWRPQSLALLVLLCGPLPGGALMAWNFRRLGQGHLALPAFAAFAAFVAVAAAAAWLTWRVAAVCIVAGDPELETPRLVTHVAALLLALVPWRLQMRRHRLWRRTSYRRASVLLPGLVAFAIGLCLHAATQHLIVAAHIPPPR